MHYLPLYWHEVLNIYHQESGSKHRGRTVGIRCIQPPDIFPLTPIGNKSCNIEWCVNNMLQIIQIMMVSQGKKIELSVFRMTTISGQHQLI